MDNERLIKSYVWHKDQCYFVSTLDRDSSAMEGPRRYAETLVWEYDWDKRERGEIVDSAEDIEGGISAHLQMCKRIFEGGHFEDED